MPPLTTTKSELYDLSVAYVKSWTTLREHVIPLMNTPLTGFSMLVNNSPHGLDCPKAHAMYKLYLANDRAAHKETLAKLQALRTHLDTWVKTLSELENEPDVC